MSAGRHSSCAFALLSSLLLRLLLLFPIIFNAVQPQSVLSFIFRVGWYACIVNSFSGLSLCLISCTYLVNFEKKVCLVLLSQTGRHRVSCTYLVKGEISDSLSWSRIKQGFRLLFFRPQFVPQRGHNASNINIIDINEKVCYFCLISTEI